MPGLSGSQKAYRYAYLDESDLGKTRLDTTRLGYFPQNRVLVEIGGTRVSGVDANSLRIDLNTGSEPHRCTFRMKGGQSVIPRAGTTVVVGHGSSAHKLFAGRVRSATVTYRRNDEKRPDYQVEAIGYQFDLSLSRVMPGVEVRSLTVANAVSLIAGNTEPYIGAGGFGFTFPFIDQNLPLVSQFITGPTEPLGQAFDRLFRSVDATYYVDHDKRFHVFGSLDPATGGTPNTLTSTTSMHWGIGYQPMDFSRVFAHVLVVAAGQSTIADVDTTYHRSLPLDGGANLLDAEDFSTNFLVGPEQRSTFLFPQDFPVDPTASLRAGQVSVFLPASAQANTLTVVSANVSSQSPLVEERWYQIGGQNVYVASVLGAYSLTVNTVSYNYFVPRSISGALTADVQAGGEIAPLWNYVRFGSTAFKVREFPAGTRIRTLISANGNSAVASLVPDYATALEDVYFATKVLDDERLSSVSARQVASEALQRGATTAWPQLDFSTRDRYVNIGRPVYASITSIAEPSGNSIVGTFIAHDLTIEGFGQLSDGKGPIRRVSAGAVRRPSLWQVLQGE